MNVSAVNLQLLLQITHGLQIRLSYVDSYWVRAQLLLGNWFCGLVRIFIYIYQPFYVLHIIQKIMDISAVEIC